MTYKLGSLFDGSGGFPLAGALCGIEPIWAAEIEPYPIAVTRSRFPTMKHLGDISKVNGAEIEPVDIITFGSPCQDLSVAGKRAGLKHAANGDEETTRSGLFMEAVRIIKEMRKATNGKYPTFALWENVPGAFSSNKGEDFRIVCEELIKIVEPTATMPSVPPKGWNYSDSYVGDGWSLAYRVLDAQYWGVPQRRRRIYLVADFRGERAREVLFEREGLRGYFTQGTTPWQATSTDAQGSTGADDSTGDGGADSRGRQLDDVGVINAIGGNAENAQTTQTFPTLTNGTSPGFTNAVAVPYTLKIRSGCAVDSAGKGAGKGALIQENLSATLATSNDQYLFQPITDSHILDDQGGSVINVRKDGKAPTLRAQMGGHPPVVMLPDAVGVDLYNCAETGEKAATLTTQGGGTASGPSVVYSIDNHPGDCRMGLDESGKAQTLTSRMGTGGGNGPMVMEAQAVYTHPQSDTWTFEKDNLVQTLSAGMGMGGGNTPLVMEPKPVICLQGNGIDRADTAGCNGAGWREDKSYTLNTVDRPAVAYGLDRASFNQGQNAKYDFAIAEEQQPTLTARGPGAVCTIGLNGGQVSPTLISRMSSAVGTTQDNLIVTEKHESIEMPAMCCTTGSFTQATEEVAPTLMARDWKDPTVVLTNYIVRRLTPTECARLQGFADRWGDIDTKKYLSDDEYRFWLEVRNTHAVINGKKEQEYTAKQMLNWYNKLQTDSAEYKMWGNGIALPTALYALQGIAGALQSNESQIEDWML